MINIITLFVSSEVENKTKNFNFSHNISDLKLLVVWLIELHYVSVYGTWTLAL